MADILGYRPLFAGRNSYVVLDKIVSVQAANLFIDSYQDALEVTLIHLDSGETLYAWDDVDDVKAALEMNDR